MVSRLKRVLLASIASVPLFAQAQENGPIKIVEPNKKVTPVKAAQIDTEKFQVGAYFGLLSVEDFNSNFVSGISVSYQLTPDWLVMANYGQTEVKQSSFERRSSFEEGLLFDRDWSYINLLGGYKLFTSRSFLGKSRKYDSDIYLFAGLNQVDFNEESDAGITLGASYRVVFTDWLVFNFDFRDHLVNRQNPYIDTKDEKLTQNLELTFGVHALF